MPIQSETLRVDDDAPALPHPERIAGYEIVSLLGEGGMGRVYRARERHPPRDVALKLVRVGGRETLARFRREVELLAALEHPSIARLYAAGEAELGGLTVPWLALEYVEGVDLVQYAERERLTLPLRLELVVAVCDAVHHAHGRGIVHRDLKPGNILVGADGRPRILDFGIARLVDDADGMTQAGEVLGTLPYMSPEQLSGRSRDVDVRSDVYALGVIAYELVSGRLPHPRLSTSSVFEAIEIVRREIPPPLSTVAPAARGDLELVVAKALAQEPERRYASAAALAADLERVLDHRPVEARPPSAGYRLRRFVRRHRALSAAALTIALVLLAATAVSLRYAIVAGEARVLAEQRAAEALAAHRFLEDMLSAADPELAEGRDVSVASVVDAAEARLAHDAPEPRVRYTVLSTLVATRAALGHYARALALVDEALALAGRIGAPPAERAALLRRRASLLTELARYDEAASAAAAARTVGGDADAAAALGLALTTARIGQEQGRNEEAERDYRALLDAAARLAPADRARDDVVETVATARSNLSAILRDRGALDESVALAREVHLERLERHGERDPRTLASRHKLALAHSARAEHDAAESEARAALALQREVLGGAHASTLTTMQTLANALLAQGELDEAEALTREALDGWESQFGPTHAQTIASMNALAYLLEERTRPAEAETLYREILERTADGTPHPENLGVRNNLAMLLVGAGRPAEALREFETLLSEAEALVGTAHPYYAIFSSNHGHALVQAGEGARAIPVLERAVAGLEATLGAGHPRTATARERLAAARAAR